MAQLHDSVVLAAEFHAEQPLVKLSRTFVPMVSSTTTMIAARATATRLYSTALAPRSS